MSVVCQFRLRTELNSPWDSLVFTNDSLVRAMLRLFCDVAPQKSKLAATMKMRLQHRWLRLPQHPDSRQFKFAEYDERTPFQNRCVCWFPALHIPAFGPEHHDACINQSLLKPSASTKDRAISQPRRSRLPMHRRSHQPSRTEQSPVMSTPPSAVRRR